jgi:acyl-CoA oxidase
MGLLGVDNGRIWFDQKRIPRDNLLNRYADVTEEGKYISPYQNKIQRFATMIAPLVFGRLKISSSSSLVALTGLKIAIRYCHQRTQFKGNDSSEVTVIHYLTTKRRLYPYLATTVAYHLLLNIVKEKYEKYYKATSQNNKSNPEENKELHILAAGVKGMEIICTFFKK